MDRRSAAREIGSRHCIDDDRRDDRRYDDRRYDDRRDYGRDRCVLCLKLRKPLTDVVTMTTLELLLLEVTGKSNTTSLGKVVTYRMVLTEYPLTGTITPVVTGAAMTDLVMMIVPLGTIGLGMMSRKSSNSDDRLDVDKR